MAYKSLHQVGANRASAVATEKEQGVRAADKGPPAKKVQPRQKQSVTQPAEPLTSEDTAEISAGLFSGVKIKLSANSKYVRAITMVLLLTLVVNLCVVVSQLILGKAYADQSAVYVSNPHTYGRDDKIGGTVIINAVGIVEKSEQVLFTACGSGATPKIAGLIEQEVSIVGRRGCVAFRAAMPIAPGARLSAQNMSNKTLFAGSLQVQDARLLIALLRIGVGALFAASIISTYLISVWINASDVGLLDLDGMDSGALALVLGGFVWFGSVVVGLIEGMLAGVAALFMLGWIVFPAASAGNVIGGLI